MTSKSRKATAKSVRRVAAASKKAPKANRKPNAAAATWRLGLGTKPPVKALLGLHHGHPAAHHPLIKAKMLSFEKAPAAAVEEQPLYFRLGDHTVQHARVTLDYAEVVVLDDVSVPSAPRPKGRWVTVVVEMIGDPGSTAKIEVINATPAALNCAIPAGVTAWAETRVVVATW